MILKKTLLTVTTIFVLTISMATLHSQTNGNGKYKIGDKVTDFAFKSDQGKTVKLSDYKGKIVVLNFFATW